MMSSTMMNISQKKKLITRFLLNPNSFKTLNPISHNCSNNSYLYSTIPHCIHTLGSSMRSPFFIDRFFSASSSDKTTISELRINENAHAQSRKRTLDGLKHPDVLQKPVSQVINVIGSGEGNYRSKLDTLGVILSRTSVFEIFRVLNSEKVPGLQFFEWVRNNNPNLSRNADICSLIIDNCGWLNDFDTMTALLEGFNHEKLCLTEKAFGFLPIVDTKKSHIMESITSVIHVLNKVGGSSRSSGIFAMIKMLCVVDSFEMAKFVIESTERKLSYYAVLVRERCRKGCFEEAYALIGEMREVGCDPDAKIYNYLLGNLCKNDKLSEAQDLLNEMLENDVIPDAITVEVFVSHSCRLGKLDSAREIFERLMHMGVVPRDTTHAAFVNSYFDVGEYEKAFKYVHDLEVKKMPSINRMYSLLATLHQRKGNVDVAQRILSEMMEKGLKPNYSVYAKTSNALRHTGRKDMARDLQSRFSTFRIS